MAGPDGTIGHALLKIGDSMVMMGEASGQWSPMPTSIYLYVNDAGASSIMEPANQFYGDRHGGVKDPSGNMWWIATHVEDVAPDEIARRAEAYVKKHQGV